jgi:hypothetical protein
MSGFQAALKAEIQKGKNSFALWLSLFGTVANVVMFSLYFLFRPAPEGVGVEKAPWEAFIVLFYDSVSFMMLPLYVIILCSLITFQEHRSGSWMNLLSLPLTRWQLYSAKQVYTLLHFVAAHLLFIVSMLLAGLLIGLFYPASGLLAFPPLGLIALLAAYTILSILGLLAFHAWISWRFSHFIIPLTIGIIGFVLAALLGPEWPGAVGFWYATPIVYMPEWRGLVEYESWGGLGLHYGASLFWFGFFTLIGYWDIRRRDMG